MKTSRLRLAVVAATIAVGLLAGSCQVDRLIGPEDPDELRVDPASLLDSAAVGSADTRPLRLTIDGPSVPWTATRARGSAWLQLGSDRGTAPSELIAVADPTGLGTGLHYDTLVVTSIVGTIRSEVRIPVRFRVDPCKVTPIAYDDAVTGGLTTADCGAPHKSGSFGRLFGIPATAGDSISVHLTSAAFPGYLVLDTAGTAAATPLATAEQCAGAEGACIRYQLVPRTGLLFVEATTAEAGRTGPFTLRVARPVPPQPPVELGQVTGDSVTPVATGAAIQNDALVLVGRLTDADDADLLRLEVEVKPVNAAFTGIGTVTGEAVANGARGFARVSGMGDGAGYHWRARAVDMTGRAGPWTSYGGNEEAAADFVVDMQRPPGVPANASQLQIDGTVIPPGGTTDERSVTFRATMSDPNPADQLRLEVELRPLGQAFGNSPSASSLPVANGSPASVSISGLTDNAAYHWQARAVDGSGRPSAWVAFGANPETAADFRVALPAARMAFIAQPGNTTAGSVLAPPVQVAAQDAAGRTLTSFTGEITLTLSGGSGATLEGTTSVTAVQGVATFSDLRVERAGTGYVLAASTPSLPGVTSAAFNVAAAAAAKLAFSVQPSNAAAGAAITPAVRVTALDAFDNQASGFGGGVTMSLGANPADGTLGGTREATAALGVATFSDLSIDKAGTGYRLAAAAPGLTSATSAPFTITAGAAGKLGIVTQPAGTAQSGVPLARQPVIQLLDPSGNPVSQAGVVVTASASGPAGAALSTPSATTAANGRATFSGLAITGPVGDYTLSFSAANVTPVTSSGITLSAGPASKLAIVSQPPSSAQSGVTFSQQPVIQALDAAGNTVHQSGIVVTATIASGGGTLGGTPSASTDAQGAVAFTDLSIAGTVGPRTLRFAAPGGGLDATTSSTVDLVAGPPTQIARNAPETQSAVAGTAVATPPAVIAKDASGNPVAGVSVTFAVTTGDGVVDPTTPIATGSDGVARVQSWTLGPTAGANSLTATASGLAGSPVTFTATATVGAATTLAKSSGDNLTGQVATTLATPHQVLVTDAGGNPVPGVRVDWVAASGGGSVNPTVSTTDVAGHASTTRTLGVTPGAQTTTATATLQSGATTVTFTATATIAGASRMVKNGGDLQKDTVGATLPVPISVRVTDDFNNPVQDVTITWSVIDGGGAVNPGTSITNAQGVAATQWTLGTRTTATDSTQALQATGVASPLNFLATSRPGAVSGARTTVTAAPAAIAASSGANRATITVTALDGFGNPVPNKAASLAATGAGNALTQPGAPTNANGVATGSLSSSATGEKSVSASVQGTPVAQQATVTVTPGPAAKLVYLTAPSNVTAGAVIAPPVQVEIRDQFDNRVITATNGVTVALGTNPAGGTLGGTRQEPAVQGVASFPDLTVDRAGTGYTLVATSTTLTGATSGAFNVTAGGVSAAQSSVVAAPAQFAAGNGSATITVTARDALGNPVSGRTVVLSSSGSGNTLTQPSGPTNASGVATGTISSTAAETKTVSATIDGVAVTQTATLNVTAGAVSAARSRITADPTSLTAGSGSATITVTARDQNDNPISGATVVLSATGSGNTVSQPVGPTNAQGAAVGTLSSTVAEAKTISADINGTRVSETASVTVTAAAVSASQSGVLATPATITAGSGSSTVSVSARDVNGNPVAGATVVLTATGDGNSLTQPGPTDVNGATSGTLSSTVAGATTVSATINGVAVTQTATVSVTAGAPANVIKRAESDQQVTPVGTPVPVNPEVRVTDASGNPVSDVTVTFTVASGGGSVTGETQTTDANGVAAVGGWTLGTTAGTNTLTATASGLPPVTFTATGTAGGVSGTQSSVAADPATISAGSGTSTITVIARDANGNPVAGATVILNATGDGNTLGQPGTTDATGTASGTLSSTLAGIKTVSATINGVAVAQAATVSVTAGAPATVIKRPESDQQVAPAGTAVPVNPEVVITDASGNPVSGATVTFAVASGGGSVTGENQTTDANGVAAVGSWTLGTTAGTNTLTATVSGLSPVTFIATGTAGGVSGSQSTIAAEPSTITAGSGTSTITVTARDANGNPIAGRSVVLTVTGDGNTLTLPPAPTAADGTASGTLTSTVAQTKTVTATIDGTAVTEAATVTVTAGPVSADRSIIAADPTTIVAGGSSTITVTARDAHDNPIAGATVELTVSGSGNALTQPGPTGADGRASGTLASTVAEVKNVSATINGAPLSQTATITVTTGAVSGTQSTVTADPTTVAAGAVVTITVTARDANENPVSGAAVTLAASGDGNTLAQPGPTSTNGVATGTLTSTVAGTKIVSVTIDGVVLSQTASVTVTSGPVSSERSTVMASPTGMASGATSTITVTARDANDNPIGDATVVLSATGDGNAIAQPGVTDASGVATGTLTSTVVGTKTVSATINGVGVSQTAMVSVTAGAPGSVTKRAESDDQVAPVGTAVPVSPEVRVTDASGNPVPGVAVTFAVASGAGSLTGESQITDANGVAIVGSWTLGTAAGANTLTATVSGVPPVTFTATGTAGGVSGTQSTIAAEPATITAGTGTTTITVTARDAHGNPIAGATVVLSATGDGNTVGQPGPTNGNGVASGTLSSTAAGSKTVSATIDGVSITQTATVAVGAGAPATVTKRAESDQQSAPVGTAVLVNPEVRVTDASGNPVAGVAVSFAVASGGGSATSADQATDANGVAIVGSWTLGTAAGTNTLTATVPGLPPVTFTATGTAGGVSGGRSTLTADPATIAAGGGASTITVTARDANDNPIADATVVLDATGSGNSFAPAATGVTDASGVMTASFTSTAAGAKTVSATINGVAVNGTAGITVLAGAPAVLTKQPGGDDQSATVGTAVPTPPAVRVTDLHGNPVPGVAVSFAAATGGGSVTGENQTTDGDGVATVGTWTLGPTTTENTLTATAAADGISGNPATFRATGTAAPATQVTIERQPSTVAVTGQAFLQQPILQLRDGFGNAVAQLGVPVTASVASGPGGVLQGTAQVSSDATGAVAFADLGILGPLGAYRLQFDAAGLTPAVSADILLVAGPPASMSKHEGDGQTASVNSTVETPPAVVVHDANGNPVAGVEVSFAVTAGGGGATGTQQTTNAQGIAAVGAWTLGTQAGENNLDATAAGLEGSPARFTATGTAAFPSPPESQLTSSPGSILASTGSSRAALEVVVEDQYGNPVSGAMVVFSASGSGNAVTQPSGPTGADGLARGSLSSTVAEAKTITATVNGTPMPQQTSLLVNPAATAALAYALQPADAERGAILAPVEVRAHDEFGNTTPAFTGNVTVSIAAGSGATGARLYGPTTRTLANGVARYTGLAIDSAALGYALSALTGGLPAVTSTPFAVLPASSALLVGAGDIASCTTTTDEATARLLDDIPGTVFTAGDNAYPNGTVANFTTCYEPTWGRHKARTRPAAGNHDYNTLGAAGYFTYFGTAAGDPTAGYYSYDLGGWHVLVLNSGVPMSAGSAQETWLRSDLAANPSQCALAVVHEPRFSSGTVHGSSIAVRPLWQALYNAGAEVVVNGDEHVYERFAKQTPNGAADPARGIRQFTAGTGGGEDLYSFGTPLANSEVRNNTTYGVLKLTLYASTYTWEFVPVAGGTFTDLGVTACH